MIIFHNERNELRENRYEDPSNAVHIDACSFSVRILNTRKVNTSTQSCTICVTKYEPYENRIKVSKGKHAHPKSYHAKTDDFSYTYRHGQMANLLKYFVLWPTNAQLFHKLSHCYMFRHYRVILRELVINTLPSYTSISNAAVGNTVYS